MNEKPKAQKMKRGETNSSATGKDAIPSSARNNTIVLLGFFYLVMAIPTVQLAIDAYTPCVSNFEGGCGMARGIAAMLSLLPSAGAFVLGILLMTQLASHPTIAEKAPAAVKATHLLWIVPLAYVLFTLRALF